MARQASDRSRSAVAAQLAELGAAARSAAGGGRAVASRPGCAPSRRSSRSSAALAGLEQRLADAEAAPVEEEPSTEARDRLRAEVAAARQAETEARLAVRTAEERARALHGRAESLRRQARQERAARERAAARPGGPGAGCRRGRRACATTPRRALAALAASLARAAAERDALRRRRERPRRPSCSRSARASGRRPPTSTG